MKAKYPTLATQAAANAVRMYTHRVLLVESNFGANQPNQMAQKLRDQHFESLETTHSSQDLLQKVKLMSPDVLILSVVSLDEATLQQLVDINHVNPLPVVVFATKHSPEFMQPVVEAGVSAYVVDDVKSHRLPVIIDLAIYRFNQMQSLCKALKETQTRLSDRKIIERAKGILMQQKKLNENEAYSQMRRSAMDNGQTMVDLSKRIIEVTDILK